MTGFTNFSSIWHNNIYPELAKLWQARRWSKWGIIHLSHIFSNGSLCSFEELGMKFSLPGPMLFYYFQLKHVVMAQGPLIEWQQSSTHV